MVDVRGSLLLPYDIARDARRSSNWGVSLATRARLLSALSGHWVRLHLITAA